MWNRWHHRKVGQGFWQLALLSVAGLSALLTGCSSTVVSPTGPTIAEDALDRAVDFNTVCVLENPAVKTDILLEAIEEGVKDAGARYVFIPAGEGPLACSYSLTYSIDYEGKTIKSVQFYTFENGIPIGNARGTPNDAGGLTFDMVSQYVQLVIERSRSGRFRSLPSRRIPVKTVPPTP